MELRGSVNKWFQSYLTNRTQVVEISQMDSSKYIKHRFQSSSRAISYNVPQGSILGPLLFLIQWNPLIMITLGPALFDLQ
jgi:hypothetical protein